MRQEKQLLLDDIQNQIHRTPTFIIMQYASLTANKVNEFRTELAKIGGTVEIMRKRVLLKAAKGAGVDLDLQALPGHIGLVFAEQDPIEMTKFVFKFSDENEKKIKVLGGRFDGLLYQEQDVEKLSKLPGKNELRAQLLSVLEAPMSQTLAVMEALLASVVYCLDNKCKQENS